MNPVVLDWSQRYHSKLVEVSDKKIDGEVRERYINKYKCVCMSVHTCIS